MGNNNCTICFGKQRPLSAFNMTVRSLTAKAFFLVIFMAISVNTLPVTSTAQPIQTTPFQCPHLPCPYVGFCDHVVPTYYHKDGHICRGCDQCTDPTVG